MNNSEYKFWTTGKESFPDYELQKLTKEVYEELWKNKDNLPEDNKKLGNLTIIKDFEKPGSYIFGRWENGFGDTLTVAPFDTLDQSLIKAFEDPDFLYINPKTNTPVYRADDESAPFKNLGIRE